MFFTHVGAAAPSSGLERATASADSRGTRDAPAMSRVDGVRGKRSQAPHVIAATLASETCAGRPLSYARDRPASAKRGGSVRPGRHESAHLFSSNGQHEAASTPL